MRVGKADLGGPEVIETAENAYLLNIEKLAAPEGWLRLWLPVQTERVVATAVFYLLELKF